MVQGQTPGINTARICSAWTYIRFRYHATNRCIPIVRNSQQNRNRNPI